MRICFLICFGLAAPLVAACGDEPSKDQCQRLLDHMVSLEAQAGGSGEVTSEMKEALEAQKKEVKADLEEDFMTYCLEQLPLAQVECALEARDLEAVSKCDES